MRALPRSGDTKANTRRGPGGLAAAFVLVFLSAAAIFTFWYLPRQRAAGIASWSRDLGARADLRRDALNRYFEAALANATTVAGYPSNLHALDPGESPALRPHVAELLEEYARAQGALGAALWSTAAAHVVTTKDLVVDDGCVNAAREVLATGAPAVGMHLHDATGPVLTFSAPVKGPNGVTRGAVTVFEDPARWLYPFLARRLAGVDTGEAALVACDGADAVLLSPLRDQPDAPLRFRKPLGKLGYSAQSAFEGSEAVSSQTDYRGIRVLTTGRRLPPSPWALVMKADEAEALKGVFADARRTAVSLAAFILAASALVWGLAQRRDRLQDAALARSEARFGALLDEADDAIFVLDPAGRVLDVNRRAERMYAAERAAMIGSTTADWRAPDARAGASTIIDEVNREGRSITTTVHRRTDGSTFPVEVRGRRVKLEAGDVLVAIVRDTTDRHRHEDAIRHGEEVLLDTQRQLAQAQKMEAVGRLAGGIAHDFNNLLTVIRGYGELLAAGLASDDARREELGEILRAAERATDLTRQLLAFSRRQTLELQALDLGAVVENAEKLLRRLIGEDVRLTFSRAPGPSLVCADPGQVEQVLMNLAVNARDAMPDGGPMTVRVSETAVVTVLASVDGGIPPGRYVVLSVADGGCGMSRETLEHAFEPFFTTKETGRGTGLGLSTVFGVVRQSGGHIRVSSAPGEGTTFELFFPQVEETDSVPAPANRAERGGTETILLVEDEASVRELAARMLRGRGYRVVAASRGGEALLAAREAGRVDLLLTDLVMPEMSGAELANRLAALRPGLRVLFMSGYPHDVLSRYGLSGTDVPLLRKPFNEADLSRRVREALDEPAAAGFAASADGGPGPQGPSGGGPPPPDGR